MRKYSEKQLIKKCVRNDRRGQELLYKKHFDMVYGMTIKYKIQESDRLLIINNTFLKVFKYIQKFQGNGSFEGWIRTISVREIYNYFGKQKKMKIFSEIEDEKYVSTQENSIQKMFFSDLLGHINELPEISKKVLSLYFIEGYKHREIAEKLKTTVSNSKYHLSQAKTKLKQVIEAQ